MSLSKLVNIVDDIVCDPLATTDDHDYAIMLDLMCWSIHYGCTVVEFLSDTIEEHLNYDCELLEEMW